MTVSVIVAPIIATVKSPCHQNGDSFDTNFWIDTMETEWLSKSSFDCRHWRSCTGAIIELGPLNGAFGRSAIVTSPFGYKFDFPKSRKTSLLGPSDE